MSVQCNLKALASYVPEQTVTNEELTAIVDTSDQWIVERTGIKCRHKLDVAQQTSDLGLFASREALCQANIDPQKLTHVNLHARLSHPFHCLHNFRKNWRRADHGF